MQLKFYNISDDKRKLVKELHDSGANQNRTATLSGHIKRDCSIKDPVFEVGYQADLMTSNYIYCPDLSRYYFIKDITVSTQRLIITAHVDVLMSFHADIDKLRCVVARQEKKTRSNLYLNDGMWHNLQKTETVCLTYNDSFSQSGSYVFATGGKS